MGLSFLTVRTVLLLAVWLLLSACIVFILPLGQFVLFVYSLIVLGVFLVPVAGLVIIHRQFLELQTLRTLSWVSIALVCVALLAHMMLIVQIFVVPEIASNAPWLFRAISLSNGFWLALLLGFIAGLRWPDRSLVPVLAPEASRELRIAVNVVAITLTAGLGVFLIGLGDSWPYWLPLPDNWQSPVLVFRRLWGFGSLVSNILVVSLLIASLAEWPGFTPQLRRVVIGGLSGVIVMIVLRQMLDGSLEVALDWLVRNDHTSYRPIGVLSLVLFSSTMVVSWLGITLGVWAGLRWPERLLLPANISGGTQRVRLAKNVIAVAVYVVLALLVHLTISLGMVFLVWD